VHHGIQCLQVKRAIIDASIVLVHPGIQGLPVKQAALGAPIQLAHPAIQCLQVKRAVLGAPIVSVHPALIGAAGHTKHPIRKTLQNSCCCFFIRFIGKYKAELLLITCRAVLCVQIRANKLGSSERKRNYFLSNMNDYYFNKYYQAPWSKASTLGLYF
jgi:hypothetical protein